MKIMVIGSGGREHTIAWKAAQSPRVSEVIAVPGSAGMSDVARCEALDVSDHDALVALAKREQIGLTIVGPEVPLLQGVVDRFQSEGLKVFGPTQAAAQLEGSKDHAKRLMARYNIPTGAYQTFEDLEAARAYVKKQGAPIVIKADGLAAGKGVVVALEESEAFAALDAIMGDRVFGDAGNRVVIEEYLDGEELSLMALVNGRTVVPLVTAQDHKRVGERDTGPNTGGMGAYSPVPQFSDADVDVAVRTILEPMADAMCEEGTPFTGVLYAGLMMTAAGPRVIEFNVRFGDPETQVVLPRMESDLVDVIEQLLDGGKPEVKWSSQPVVGVVMASTGYPGKPQTGATIKGISKAADQALVFHAGTDFQQDHWVTAGGRVLLVAGKGDTLQDACDHAYHALDLIESDGLFYRKDIGHRALKRLVK